jgi:hypothetical protein
MDTNNLSEEEKAEWWLFLKANPIGVDPNIISPEAMAELPENVRKALWADSTSSLIYLLGYENGLDEEKISDIARIVRQIALGEISSAELTKTLCEKLGISNAVAQKISSKLTTNIIAPNYFQISQLYEKKHRATPEQTPSTVVNQQKPLSGRPLESMTPKTEGEPPIGASFALKGEKAPSSLSDWAKLEEDKDAPRVIENKPSKNVVDLRSASGPLPSKLPPAPPVVPNNLKQ